jgi:hypothetical protein
MFTGAIFLPSQIGDLISVIRTSSKYTAPFEKPDKRTHVIVCGNLEIVSLRGFLREFYSPDHGMRTLLTHVVIIGYNEPEEELVSLMTDPVYANRVQYVKGSVMSFRSLQKAHLCSAAAAFVLASKISDVEPVEEDARTVMRCVSMRKYHSKLKIFAQVLLPRNKIHLENIGKNFLW